MSNKRQKKIFKKPFANYSNSEQAAKEFYESLRSELEETPEVKTDLENLDKDLNDTLKLNNNNYDVKLSGNDKDLPTIKSFPSIQIDKNYKTLTGTAAGEMQQHDHPVPTDFTYPSILLKP